MNKAELIKAFAIADLLAEKMELGEEPTNGEMLQALFPNMKTEDTSFKSLIGTDLDGGYVPLLREWWNSPYQKGGEE